MATKTEDDSIGKVLADIDRELNDEETTDQRRRQLRAALRRVRDSKAATDAEKRLARLLLEKHGLEDDEKKSDEAKALSPRAALTRPRTSMGRGGVQQFHPPTSRTAALKRDLAQKSRTAVAFEQARRNVEMTARSVETCKAAVATAEAELDFAMRDLPLRAERAEYARGEFDRSRSDFFKAKADRAAAEYQAAVTTADARRADLERAERNLEAAERSHRDALRSHETALAEYHISRG